MEAQITSLQRKITKIVSSGNYRRAKDKEYLQQLRTERDILLSSSTASQI